jgi:hypothetical protein
MCRVWRGYDVAGVGGGEFTLRLIPHQKVAPLYWRSDTHTHMRPHVSGTDRVGFLKQDACGSLVVASLPVNFPFSAFCRKFLVRTSIGLNTNHTFLSLKNSQTDTFLRDLGLAKLRSTAWVWNPQGISKLVIKVDCCLSYDSFLALCSQR